jgi:hypothetical protein
LTYSLKLLTASKKTALPPLANANVNKSVPEARKKRSYKKKQATVDGPLLAQNIASDNKCVYSPLCVLSGAFTFMQGKQDFVHFTK